MHSLKVIVSIALLLTVIIVSSIFQDKILTNTSETMGSKVSEIEETINTEDWQNTKNILTDLETDWMETEKKWAIIIDHFEIDNIDISIKRMAGYIEAMDQSSALAEAKALNLLIKHIPAKTALKIKNIF